MRKKAERRWTVMVVPHGSGLSRAVEVSQTFLKTLLGIGSVVALTFLVLGVAALSRGVNITRSRALENENRVLANEIQQMRERMAGLRDTLHRFSEREQELRLLAGRTPTDTSVQQPGIGGPAGAWLERDSLKALGRDGQEALAARLDVDALARRANILVRSLNQAYDTLSRQRERLAATPSIMPTRGWLTSAFMAERVHPILHLARPHEGIDVSAPMGAEIEAPAAGIVTDVKWEEGYGNMITLDHGFGLVTRFAHCSKISVASLGWAAAVGCSGGHPGIEHPGPQRPGSVITADAIAASGAKTAWDAVRLTVKNVQLRERRGRAAGIQRRGQASIYLDDQVRVILDNARIYDLQVLQQVAAADIYTIEVLTGLEATTYYGASSTSGVIVITTTNGRP